MTTVTQTIQAKRVPNNRRSATLPRHFPRNYLSVENAIYNLIGDFSADYTGGHWDFYSLSNGGFYMTPDAREDKQPYRVCIVNNGYEGSMSADALGIVVCIYVFNSFAARTMDDAIIELCHKLRDFALEHAECRAIFAAID